MPTSAYLIMEMSHIGIFKTSIRKRKTAASCDCFHIATLANEATDEVFTSEFKADYNAVVSALGKLNLGNWCGLIFAMRKSLSAGPPGQCARTWSPLTRWCAHSRRTLKALSQACCRSAAKHF